ncbi:MAG: TSUP family transporter [Clostridia bacterium]|nr:TSUP family transporter [Clostridia bacterium]
MFAQNCKYRTRIYRKKEKFMDIARRSTHLGALLVCGLAAGMINGLLGTGGGISLVFAISYFCKNALPDRRDVCANALVVTLALTLLSTTLYVRGGNAPPADLSRFVLPGAAGGLIGGLLLGKITPTALGKLFAVLLVVSGIFMLVR